MAVLVVCTGNTCRSAMAEHLLRARGTEAVSAGTDVTVVGEPMTGHALTALARRGIDGSGHRAQRLTAELVERAERVLVMTPEHRDAVLRLVPGAAVEVLDVADPYGGSPDGYAACCDALERVLEGR